MGDEINLLATASKDCSVGPHTITWGFISVLVVFLLFSINERIRQAANIDFPVPAPPRITVNGLVIAIFKASSWLWSGLGNWVIFVFIFCVLLPSAKK